jgi:hypothetical protein
MIMPSMRGTTFCKLMLQLLGWKPRVALKEGLISTAEYFERLLSDNALRAQLAKEATVGPA